jgi:hypothetical protein
MRPIAFQQIFLNELVRQTGGTSFYPQRNRLPAGTLHSPPLEAEEDEVAAKQENSRSTDSDLQSGQMRSRSASAIRRNCSN